MINFTASAYLTQIWNAFTRGRGLVNKHLVIRCSQELHDQLLSEHGQATRWAPDDTNTDKRLVFKTTRLEVDPSKTGIQVWIGSQDD